MCARRQGSYCFGPLGSSAFWAGGRRLAATLRIASASARSWGLPDASFEARRSSAEIKFALKPVAGSIRPSFCKLSICVSSAEKKTSAGAPLEICSASTIDARNIGQNIDAVRIPPKTKETAAVGEVLRADTLERYAEPCQSRIGRFRVCGIGFYEYVHVLRKPGLRVKDNREASDHEVFNAMGMEGGQKVFVVLVHPARSPNP